MGSLVGVGVGVCEVCFWGRWVGELVWLWWVVGVDG